MFELHITCTKDISNLHIDFTDGTCVVKESKPSEKPKTPKPVKDSKIPDWESYNKQVKSEIVPKPEVPELNRQPKIDEVLNNLEI